MMETSFARSSQVVGTPLAGHEAGQLFKRINTEKDVVNFRTLSPAYKDVQIYIDALCDLIQGTGSKTLNHKYVLKEETCLKCSKFFHRLGKDCDSIDLTQPKWAATLRFGHVAFRDWYDGMKDQCKEFIFKELTPESDTQLKEELQAYLTESFGNRMRIDYGTGHELNFILFSMGLMHLMDIKSNPDSQTIDSGDKLSVSPDTLKSRVDKYGWDILALYAHDYLRLCRNIQKKFRLEPAGSRGVYNMDDFQFLPFLFGVAQLVDVKYVSCNSFYDYEQVDMWKNDFIFFEAIDYILKNKRGPFNEHSYTLWCFTSLNSWANILRKIKAKFIDDVLTPFPIIQHLLFGKYILRWE